LKHHLSEHLANTVKLITDALVVYTTCNMQSNILPSCCTNRCRLMWMNKCKEHNYR